MTWPWADKVSYTKHLANLVDHQNHSQLGHCILIGNGNIMMVAILHALGMALQSIGRSQTVIWHHCKGFLVFAGPSGGSSTPHMQQRIMNKFS